MVSYLLLREENKVWSWLIDRESGQAIEVHIDDAKPDRLQIGDIVTARVSDIKYSLGGAFLDIPGPDKKAWLSLEDAVSPVYLKKGSRTQLQPSDELIVQVKREAIKSKDMSVTTKLSLQGRYCVIDHCTGSVGVSRKLPPEQRERLRELGKAALADMARAAEGRTDSQGPVLHPGILLRTNAAAAAQEEIQTEIVTLTGRLQKLAAEGIHRSVPCVLHTQPPAWLERLRSLPLEEDLKILTEDPEIFEMAETFLKSEVPALTKYLIRYNDPMLALPRLYSIQQQTAQALSRTVHLKDGGFLVIEPTEALTVIDVNTGKNAPKGTRKDKEQVMLKTNLLAAREAARQMRLRNLSGIILIDFINMEQEESREKLVGELNRQMLQDPLRPSFIDITPLGLAEITRKKVEKPLHEVLKISLPR